MRHARAQRVRRSPARSVPADGRCSPRAGAAKRQARMEPRRALPAKSESARNCGRSARAGAVQRGAGSPLNGRAFHECRHSSAHGIVARASVSLERAMSESLRGVLSRRELMRRAWSAGAGLMLAAAASGADRDRRPLITKPIPSSGEHIPVIGLGTIWFREAQYPQLRVVLQRMHALGGTVIDTAAAYGESEGVVGRALADTKLRGKMFVATKLTAGGPRPSAPPGNGPPQG